MNNCSISYSNCWNYNIGTIIFINIMWYVNRILSSQNIIQQLPDCNEDETTDSLLNYKWITSNTYWRLVTYTFFDVISSVWERYYGNFGNGVEECTGSGNIFYELLEMMMPCILMKIMFGGTITRLTCTTADVFSCSKVSHQASIIFSVIIKVMAEVMTGTCYPLRQWMEDKIFIMFLRQGIITGR